MRIALRVAAGLIVLVGAVLLIQRRAAESGEVVVLYTGADASRGATRLWVVDHEGRPWLRAGTSAAGWLAAVRKEPQVTVERDGRAERHVAVPVPAARTVINALMRAKYGAADRLIEFLLPRADAVPVRLDPAPQDGE